MRKFKNDTSAGVTTYVMVMVGMIFILYLFGFTSVFSSYVETELGYKETEGGPNITLNITNPALASRPNVMNIIGKVLTDNLLLVAGGVVGLVVLGIIATLTNTAATILQFLIPLLLLGALNIFVFPLNSFHEVDLSFMGFAISTMLFIFFNLFYILAVVDFVRGSNS